MLKLILSLCLVLVVAGAAAIRSGEQPAPAPAALTSQPPSAAASTQDANPAPAPAEIESSSPVQRENRLDLDRLRRAVRKGDVWGVLGIPGEPDSEEAAALLELKSEIPLSTAEEDRLKIVAKLMELLRQTPGDGALRGLLSLISQEREFFYKDANLLIELYFSMHELGRRQFHEAVPFLESWALQGSMSDDESAQILTSLAARALMQIDREGYLPVVVARVKASPDSTLWIYLGALDEAADSANPAVGKMVPELQARYVNVPRESYARYMILEMVGTYAMASKSREMRHGAVTELKEQVKVEKTRTDPDKVLSMKDLYQSLLEKVEKEEP